MWKESTIANQSHLYQINPHLCLGLVFSWSSLSKQFLEQIVFLEPSLNHKLLIFAAILFLLVITWPFQCMIGWEGKLQLILPLTFSSLFLIKGSSHYTIDTIFRTLGHQKTSLLTNSSTQNLKLFLLSKITQILKVKDNIFTLHPARLHNNQKLLLVMPIDEHQVYQLRRNEEVIWVGSSFIQIRKLVMLDIITTPS